MIPLDIAYTDFEPSDSLSDDIRIRLERLEHHFENIQSCKVVVSSPHKHHKNKFFHVQIKLHVPGKTLVVDHEPEKNKSHQDPYLSVRDAFDAMDRQLKSYVERMRGNIKNHSKQ